MITYDEIHQIMRDEEPVECYSAHDPNHVIYRGIVRAYLPGPGVVVDVGDGQTQTWLAELTRPAPVPDPDEFKIPDGESASFYRGMAHAADDEVRKLRAENVRLQRELATARQQVCDDFVVCNDTRYWCTKPLGHRGWHSDGTGTEWRSTEG